MLHSNLPEYVWPRGLMVITEILVKFGHKNATKTTWRIVGKEGRHFKNSGKFSCGYMIVLDHECFYVLLNLVLSQRFLSICWQAWFHYPSGSLSLG